MRPFERIQAMINENLKTIASIDTEHVFTRLVAPFETGIDSASFIQNYTFGLSRYLSDFIVPYLSASTYFSDVETRRAIASAPDENARYLMELFLFNLDLSAKGCSGSLKAFSDYAGKEIPDAITAYFNAIMNPSSSAWQAYIKRKAKALDIVTHDYPRAIKEVEPEFGFHFERGKDELFMETDRYFLYRVNPTLPDVTYNPEMKPVLIIPPYVLGANVLGLLPYENRSYTHAFANQGIPTYIRIMKPILEHPAVQLLTGEDDTLDTALFCREIMKRHKKPITLNGYCQGGFTALCNVLSGKLDGIVDTMITCVSPIDGYQSKGLSTFLTSLPHRYNDLAYGTKTLPNGNRVADGNLMSWVYKLKSIESEFPLVLFFRDLAMIPPHNGEDEPIFNKTSMAINYWLRYDRTDIPLGITEMSFASFNAPIADDGTLPVTQFGKKLNIKRIQEKGIKWLICYGEKDDLVESASALAPTRFIDVEVTPFPKGHVAIATSWSNPKSAYALHERYENGTYRGPIRFQLDRDKEISKTA